MYVHPLKGDKVHLPLSVVTHLTEPLASNVSVGDMFQTQRQLLSLTKSGIRVVSVGITQKQEQSTSLLLVPLNWCEVTTPIM